MAGTGLIDTYLAALRQQLGAAADADEVLAEAGDHLRETASTHRRAGVDQAAAEARALAAFGDPGVVARSFAAARRRAWVAVPTVSTRRAGLAAVATPVALLASAIVLTLTERNGADWGVAWYTALNTLILLTMVLVIVALVGLHERHGGLGGLGITGISLVGLGTTVVLAMMSWALPFWLLPTAAGIGVFGTAMLRARMLPRIPILLLGTGLLLPAVLSVRYGLAAGSVPEVPWAVVAAVGVVVFQVGLVWLGWILRSERAVALEPVRASG